MRKNIVTRITLALFVLVFALFNTLPALASAPHADAKQAKITITNRSGAAIQVKLTGAGNYTINALPGKTVQFVNRGDYRYTYKVCGAEKKGEISSGGKLAIAACPTAKIAFFNYTQDFVTVSMTGANTYTFQLPPGVTRQVVIAGVYRYTAYFCGDSHSIAVNLTKGKWFDVFTCED